MAIVKRSHHLSQSGLGCTSVMSQNGGTPPMADPLLPHVALFSADSRSAMLKGSKKRKRDVLEDSIQLYLIKTMWQKAS